MELLTGEYRNTLDEKGRIPFPAKLRFELTGENLIITQAVDRCLWLFPAEEWKNFSEKLILIGFLKFSYPSLTRTRAKVIISV